MTSDLLLRSASHDARPSGARGLEVTIFNPRLDPGGGLARRLSDLITNVIPARQNRVNR